MSQSISLIDAIKKRELPAVQSLLAAGVDVNIKDANDKTPLYIATEADDDGIVNALLAAGADVNVDVKGKTPLWMASRLGTLKIVQSLIMAGADVNKSVRPPLIIASQHFYPEFKS